MSQLAYDNEIVISSLAETIETITPRKTIVYKTLIDPSVIRIEAEKNKHKLFRKFLFLLNNPADIEYLSTEKFYEPYTTTAGKYLIDYYRKCAHQIRIDQEVKEVILLDHTFLPEQSPHSSKHSIILRGEERIIKETKAFILLNKDGQESKLSEIPPAPSEENSQDMIESFKMPDIAPDVDIEFTRKRIVRRPNDINRIVNEVFEIEERSLIYTPRFKITYKASQIGKEAYFVFDGVTSKMIPQNKNILSKTIDVVRAKMKRLLD